MLGSAKISDAGFCKIKRPDSLRRQDWAVSEQQFDLAYRGVAVPLRDNRGQVLAALNISMPMGNESTEHAVSRVLPQMQETAQRLRQLL